MTRPGWPRSWPRSLTWPRTPSLPRPTLRIAFTPDEEIGEGATLFDIERFGALCAYTMDGSGVAGVDDETFSADEVIATIHGVDVHPGYATGKLVSALRLAAQIVARPALRSPHPDHELGARGLHPSLRADRFGGHGADPSDHP